MRGDRPDPTASTALCSVFTPHARGSTQIAWATDIRLQVYPACAGIDPHTAPSAAVRTSLPRMRGDRPYKVEQDYVKKRFTPHARGSTAGSHWPRTRPQVYPACAGIDPSGTHRWSTLKRLPRMRGDRPRPEGTRASGKRFTPHARGSTVNSTRSSAASYVYPACAGIDRVFFTVSKFSSRLPRMRGDRPTEPIEWFRLIVFTPHTRGQIAVRRV